jgi:hypothetical protein
MDVREILHWLVERIETPHYARVGAPTAADVHAAIDDAHDYVKPVVTAVDQAAAELAAAQAKLDAARAEAAAGVEHADDER